MSYKKETRRRLYEGFGVLEEDNSKTNIEHISNNSNTETKTIVEQNVKQFSINYKTNIEHISNNSNTETKTIVEQNVKQFSINSKTSKGILSVVGLQRKILDYLFSKAQNKGSLNTGKIFTEILAEILACSVETVRTSLQRLEKKGLIIRKEYKSGRGGFSIFEIENTAYQNMIIENNSKTIVEQFRNNSNTQTKTETKTKVLNSSSNDLNILKETTTIQVPENLKNTISLREVVGLLEKGLISEDDLSRSLDHFSYDLENNLVRSKTSPINLFYGLIRSGQRYKSLKLLELENKELQDYQSQLQKLEEENRQLKELELKEKYQQFKSKNPEFLERLKAENTFLKTNEMADKIGYSKFLEIETRGLELNITAEREQENEF